jgi:adenylate kinase
MEENIFHYMFKSAWHNDSEIQVFGKGINFVPTIHIMDLAAYVDFLEFYSLVLGSFDLFSVLQNLADNPLKTRYVIATDASKDTLMRLTRKVSQVMSTGKVNVVDRQDAVLNRDIMVNHL